MAKVNTIGVDLAKNVIQSSVISPFGKELQNRAAIGTDSTAPPNYETYSSNGWRPQCHVRFLIGAPLQDPNPVAVSLNRIKQQPKDCQHRYPSHQTLI